MVDSRAIAKALTYALEDGWTVDQEWDRKERHEARARRTASRDVIVNRAYQILGKKRPERPEHERAREIQNEQTEVSLYGLPGGYGELTFYGDGSSVGIRTGHIPAQVALEILAVLVLHKDDEKS